MQTSLLLLTFALGMLVPDGSADHVTLSFEQRVQAREAIARVQYRHQIEATQPFEQAVPRRVLERDVRDFMAQSVVLKDLWGARVTPEMLQAETDRISRATRLPRRLAELRAALGGDEVLIQEALVRPVLVSRLFHERFDSDPIIQAGPLEEAQAIASGLADGTLSPLTDHPRRQARRPDEIAGTARRTAATGKVVQESGAFVVRAPFEQDGHFMVAEYAVPRVTWNEWWQASSGRFDPSRALETVARTSREALADGHMAGACQPGDTWADGILLQPGPVTGAYQAVWTGSVYVVIASWSSMARYDPTLDAWLPMSITGAPVSARPTAVWSGREVILWGGATTCRAPFPSPYPIIGSRYDPVTDTWTPFDQNCYSRSFHTAIWTGSKMIIWGGLCEPSSDSLCQSFGGYPRYYGDALSYEPVGGVWTSISSSPGGYGTGATAIWTGNRMIVWGGFYTFWLGPGPDGTGWDTVGTGGMYDPASGSWEPIPYDAAVQDRSAHRAVWDGRHMYILGGSSSRHTYDPCCGIVNTSEGRPSVARFDPVSRSWENLGMFPAYANGDRALWTGRWILSLGAESTGGRLDPTTALWSPISSVGAPVPRYQAAVDWDGEGMLVHGGRVGPSGFNYQSDGGRYFPDPVTDADADADGFSRCGGDCDDANPAINPLATEACNGADDDCDGVQDNGNPEGGAACGITDVGACSLGVTTCSAGALACVGEVGPSPEICNGLDDDCDNDVPAAEADADHDGYRGCAGDCRDADPRVHPGATDLPGDLRDENCDGTAACSPASTWTSHGAFVLCVVHECVRLVDAGQATAQQCHAAIAAAAKSKVGSRLDAEEPAEEQHEQEVSEGVN